MILIFTLQKDSNMLGMLMINMEGEEEKLVTIGQVIEVSSIDFTNSY